MGNQLFFTYKVKTETFPLFSGKRVEVSHSNFQDKLAFRKKKKLQSVFLLLVSNKIPLVHKDPMRTFRRIVAFAVDHLEALFGIADG